MEHPDPEMEGFMVIRPPSPQSVAAYLQQRTLELRKRQPTPGRGVELDPVLRFAQSLMATGTKNMNLMIDSRLRTALPLIRMLGFRRIDPLGLISLVKGDTFLILIAAIDAASRCVKAMGDLVTLFAESGVFPADPILPWEDPRFSGGLALQVRDVFQGNRLTTPARLPTIELPGQPVYWSKRCIPIRH